MNSREKNSKYNFSVSSNTNTAKPRLGFLGVGNIGLKRLMAIDDSGMANTIAICDLSEDCLSEAVEAIPRSCAVRNPEELFSYDLDGIIIATPNALHAEQSIAALEAGMAVFCQKPLGCSTEETKQIIRTAEKADKLLAVDFSYRFTYFKIIYDLIRQRALGDIYGINLVFHNGYGPGKAWFYDPAKSGGGCVIDLGIHLIDLALWCLDFPEIESVQSSCFCQGQPLNSKRNRAEDFAAAQITTRDGTLIQFACSWNLPVGRPAKIEATFYGTISGASFTNKNGSFYDFQVEQFRGTQRQILADAPDNWSGRAALDWVEKLNTGCGFSKEAFNYIETAQLIDKIYQR